MSLFPDDSAARKTFPVYSGLLQYFPAALAAVANHSHKGNEKHNPGKPLHHDRAKSDDEADALVRHLMEGDYVGMAWRALALLQKHQEANGAPVAPGARNAQADGDTDAHRSAFAVDRNGETIDISNRVRIASSTARDAEAGFGVGVIARVAGRQSDYVFLQVGAKLRWLLGTAVEVAK